MILGRVLLVILLFVSLARLAVPASEPVWWVGR